MYRLPIVCKYILLFVQLFALLCMRAGWFTTPRSIEYGQRLKMDDEKPFTNQFSSWFTANSFIIILPFIDKLVE